MVPLSGFRFTNPFLVKLTYDINPSFDVKKELAEFNFPVALNVARSNQQAHESDVILECILGDEEQSSPFRLSITMQATFQWGNDYSDDMVEKLLSQNAPSLLLSYIRPHVVQITDASPFATGHIPFLDFTQMASDS